jgi:hypothetical protein
MRGVVGIFVFTLATSGPLAVAQGHGSSRGAFGAPTTTMSGTEQVSTAASYGRSLPRTYGRGATSGVGPFAAPTGRGAAQNSGRNGGTNGQNGENEQNGQQGEGGMFNLPMGGSGSSSSGPTEYKPNKEMQDAIAKAGQETGKLLSKLTDEVLATATSATDNFLKSVNSITAQKPEPFDAMERLAAGMRSTTGNGQTATNFQALFKESAELLKTRQDILLKMGEQQRTNVQPPQPVATPAPVAVIDRINAAIAAGRPLSGTNGNPLNYLPPGMDAGGSTPLNDLAGDPRPAGL